MHLRSLGTVMAWALCITIAAPMPAAARIRLENICTVLERKVEVAPDGTVRSYGAGEIKLTGLGLVVGLNGTGDGGDALPAIRALAAALKLMNNPVVELSDLRNAKNVAIVMVEASIPRTGLRRGQTIDCYVSSFLGAKSLRGGRLLVTPVETARIDDDEVVGLASGPLRIEDANVETTAKIPGGIVVMKDFVPQFVDVKNGHVITLVLDAAHSSYHSASEVARVINDEFKVQVEAELARAVGPGVIEVVVPKEYHTAPVDFVADLLNVSIDDPHTQARVVVNSRTGTVVVTGAVEISPVVISHKNLTVQVAANPAATAPGGGFVPLADEADTSRQLEHLVQALNQLRVPTDDIIDIISELHRSGKLHAVYEEH